VNKLLQFQHSGASRRCQARRYERSTVDYCGLLFAALIFTALRPLPNTAPTSQGTVLDQNGAALNARTCASPMQAPAWKPAPSRCHGRYRFLSLAPGQYQLERKPPGLPRPP